MANELPSVGKKMGQTPKLILFEQREIFDQRGLDAPEFGTKVSETSSIKTQVEEWAQKSGVLLISTSAPAVSFNYIDSQQRYLCRITSLSIIYVFSSPPIQNVISPLVESVNSGQEETSLSSTTPDTRFNGPAIEAPSQSATPSRASQRTSRHTVKASLPVPAAPVPAVSSTATSAARTFRAKRQGRSNNY